MPRARFTLLPQEEAIRRPAKEVGSVFPYEFCQGSLRFRKII